jgi:hypothetical protein
MIIELPEISSKLDELRLRARALHHKGLKEESIELMRISRGEVRLESGSLLYGLTATDMAKAKSCTLLQRKIIAANEVEGLRYGSTEDDYHDAQDRHPRFPPRLPKNTAISDVAKKHKLTPGVLERFMKRSGWKYKEAIMGPEFQYPDWHPENNSRLFRGDRTD